MKSLKQIAIFALPVGIIVFLSWGTVLGATPGNDGSYGLSNPLSAGSLIEFTKKIVGAIVRYMMPLLVLALIGSGVAFVTAQGNPEKVQIAKRALLYTVIGAAIVLGAYVLTVAVEETVKALG